MPRTCGVVNCSNRGERDKKSFFRMPAALRKGGPEKVAFSAKRRERWIGALRRADLTETKLKYMWICEDHFISGKPADLMDTSSPDWVPSINLGYETPVNHLDSDQRAEENILSDLSDDSHKNSNNLEPPEKTARLCEEISITEDITENNEKSIQTNMTMKDIEQMLSSLESYVVDTVNLKNEVKALKKMDENSFRGDNIKTKYYTGVTSFILLKTVFEIVEPYLSETHKNVLTKFQQFLVCMMHLRLNADFYDLAYRFNVSSSTVSRAFNTCLDVFCKRMENFVVWPERDSLLSNVPSPFFQVFGNKVTVIIDCFEVEIDRPPDLMAEAETSSNCKEKGTMKFLIGITPQGAICFISNAWGGKTNDRFIIENCGILDKLIPGDLILSYRDLDAQGSVNLCCCEVKSSTCNTKKELSTVGLQETPSLASVRFFVERVTGSLQRKYKVLLDPMPVSMIANPINGTSIMDQILITICGIINLCPSILTQED